MEAGHLLEGRGYAIWRSNGTTDWLLIHTVGGCGRLGTSTDDIKAEPGTTTLIPPGVPHDYGVEEELERWELRFAHFYARPEWLSLLGWPEVAGGIRQIRTRGAIEQRISSSLEQAAHLGRSVLKEREIFAYNALERALLWCSTQTSAEARLDGRILQAVETIQRRLREPLTISDLARASTLSVSRFSHLFHDQVGMTPRDFLEHQRISVAKQLLDLTTRPIGAIAREVGFANPLYFSARFRHVTGLSPSKYRDRVDAPDLPDSHELGSFNVTDARTPG